MDSRDRIEAVRELAAEHGRELTYGIRFHVKGLCNSRVGQKLVFAGTLGRVQLRDKRLVDLAGFGVGAGIEEAM